MKTKVLLIGGIAAATVLASGWALAQTHSHQHGTTGSAQTTQGMGPHGMGHGHMQQKMQHMGQGHMGQGRMGQGHMGQSQMQHRGQGGMGPGMMQRGAGQSPFDPARLATLKAELVITAAQETAWTKYTTAVQDAATAMSTTRAGIAPNTVRNMSPADRFAFVTKIREQAQARFTAVQTAANELLAVLDDTQKAKARDSLPGLALGPGRAASINQQQHQHQH